MTISHVFTASLTNPGTAELHAVQGDDGRVVVARVYAGTEPWQIPEGTTAHVGYELPDGTAGCYDQVIGSDGQEEPACSFRENLVQARLAALLCRAPGTVKAVITLNREGKRISTFPFRLHVAARPGMAEDPTLWPESVPAFAGKLYWGGEDGSPVPLGIGEDLQVADGTLRLSDQLREQAQASIQQQLEALKEDLLYEPIAIIGISVSPPVAQLGEVVVNPTVSWTVSREPVEQSVAGVSVDPQLRSYTVQGSYSKDAPISVAATDERGATASKSTAIAFYNAVYCTSHWSGEGLPTDGQLQAMEHKLQAGRGLTIQAEAGEGEYILYACPKRMGTPEFWVNGFQGGFSQVGMVAHYNAFRYREEYSVWVSNAAGLNLTVTVK